MPLRYEVFAGNTADVTTVEHIVEMMERRYGKSNRIWVMDRGMVSEDNMEFLREGGRRYIVGTPKSMLKKFEQDILKEDWHSSCATRQVSAVNPAESLRNSPRSVQWTWYSQPEPAPRSVPAASANPPATNKSGWKNSGSSCLPK